jgi:hypothetical protein
MNVQENVNLFVSVQDNGCFTGRSNRPLFSGEITITFKKAEFARNYFGIYN